MFDKAMDLPVSWHKDHHSGDTIDKINKASENLYQFAGALFFSIEIFVDLFGSLIMLLIFDWKAVIMASIISAFAIFTVGKIDRAIRKEHKKIYKAENYLASGIHDYISNIITIVTLRLKAKVSKVIENRSMKAFPAYKKNCVLSEFKWASASFFIAIMTAVVLITHSWFSFQTKGTILIGTLYVLFNYLRAIGNTFYQLAWRMGEIVKQEAAVSAADVINQTYDKISTQKQETKYLLPSDWKHLLIKNLTFSYKENEKKSERGHDLKNVKIRIARNSRIALIGESGSGKSTLLSLIRGLHEPLISAVYADGKKLPHGLKHFHEHVTLIPQDPEIFNTTIKDNITMGLKTSKQDLDKAIELACFGKVIERLQKGLQTHVMEKGVSLSGGEKQRLALARGLLIAKKYDFILLDEPTSSVDSANELTIYQNIFRHFQDKTILSSIHRLHLLRYFDYIYYFKNGKLITQGTFTTLVYDPHFKSIWESYHKKQKTTL